MDWKWFSTKNCCLPLVSFQRASSNFAIEKIGAMHVEKYWPKKKEKRMRGEIFMNSEINSSYSTDKLIVDIFEFIV